MKSPDSELSPPRPLLRARSLVLLSVLGAVLPIHRVLIAETPAVARANALKANNQLDVEWRALGLEEAPQAPALRAAAPMSVADERALEKFMTPPERQSMARQTTAAYVEPDVIVSKNGELRMTLTCAHARNRIGDDPVNLRAYNGKLVGPTLRAKPGDTLYILLKNDMEPENWHPDMMNELNSFNTTNLHTHGLHVSPGGISDNVLIQVGPKATQAYEIKIPSDHVPGTFWYHAHRHGSTAGNVASGMSGALIIDGPGLDDVPAIKAAKERTLVLNQIPYVNEEPVMDPDTGKQKIDPATGQPMTRKLSEGVIELKYAGTIFAPGYWAQSGRFTTVNGVQLPVIRLRPGQVERWRIVDSGQRESLNLMLMRSPDSPATLPDTLPFYEIANDGLPLGKLVKSSSLVMYPGYRSDALVQAPNQPGEYLLIDENTPDQSGMNGIKESRKHIARIIVEGEPMSMQLPNDGELAKFRLRSVADSELVPAAAQTATYGIIDGPNKSLLFTIDKMSFDMEQARTLRLGDVAEWTLHAKNLINGQPIPVAHPFHIHVNPFEVISVKDANDVEQLTNGPVWRDTQIIPGGGTVVLRTRYEDFAGTFVQHCHILDHEDQGMMELIDIIDPKAPTAMLTPPAPAPSKGSEAPALGLVDAAGKAFDLAQYRGKSVILFFFKGHGCLHCAQQVAAFSERFAAFQKQGVQIVGITTDDAAALKTALEELPCPFPILADPKGKAFAAYGCANASGALHGTFRIDDQGRVDWSHIATSPYLAVDTLLANAGSSAETSTNVASVAVADVPAVTEPEASAAEGVLVTAAEPPGAADAVAAPATPTEAAVAAPLVPNIEIRIRNTDVPTDDYITWAPAACSIRLTPGTATQDQQVVLTNDTPNPAQPAGDVCFAPTVKPGQTATQGTLTLTLPASGDWVPFVIAGAFGHPSSSDKDAVIEVHASTQDGALLKQQGLMVRIRKNHTKLSTAERDRLLSALAYMRYELTQPGAHNYAFFVRIHQMASLGLAFGVTDDQGQLVHPELKFAWPDLAHKGPGFIGWHRAFLLEFEREIQKQFPDVALPYWIMDEPNSLFTADFVGANTVNSAAIPVEPQFALTNPLHNWNLSVDNEPPGQHIQRLSYLYQPGEQFAPPLSSQTQLFGAPNAGKFSLYPLSRTAGGFVEALEFNPHNLGHNWLGPWMQNCQTSPRDPVFWIFHTGFDRLWAAWQRQFNRFDPKGGNNSYCPLGDFDNPGPNCATASGSAGQKDCNTTNPSSYNLCVPVNHNLNDAMWPWNMRTGNANQPSKARYPQPDLAQPLLHLFPAATLPDVWPSKDSSPRQADMIDYLGLSGGGDMNFAYDDTPYGSTAPTTAPPMLASNTSDLTDASKPLAARMAAAEALGHAPSAAQIASASQVIHDSAAPAALRLKAFRAVQHSPNDAVAAATRLLSSPTAAPTDLAVASVQALAVEMMQAHGDEAAHAIMPALDAALTDSRPTVRHAAVAALVANPHGTKLETVLSQALAKPEGALFSPLQAIRSLTAAGKAHKQADLIRSHLKSSDSATKQAAIEALATEPSSSKAIGDILASDTESDAHRIAALRPLSNGNLDHLPTVLSIIKGPANSSALRGEAIASLRSAMRSTTLPGESLKAIADTLGALSPADAQAIGPIVGQVLLSTTQKLQLTK